MDNTATPRQRWALYCITKKDYRNEVLSKEEAAKLIKELGDPQYKKKNSKKTIEDELLDYLKEHIDEMYQVFLDETDYKSIIEDKIPDSNGKKQRWAFVGLGCGMTFLKYRKSKNAIAIDEAARKYRGHEVLQMIVKKIPKKDYNYLKKIGCNAEAIWYQTQNIQLKYYQIVRDFAKTKGIEMQIESYLD